jgi:hypothetical protein
LQALSPQRGYSPFYRRLKFETKGRIVMDGDNAYISDIPAEAQEKRTDTGRVEYYVGKEMVGIRLFSKSVDLQMEYAFKGGVRHGRFYRWTKPGKLRSMEPYENGVPHGTAYQWADDGTVLGTYTIEYGTGTDLWWQDMDGNVTLSEVHPMKNGKSHGFEWWFSGDQTLWKERHWLNGEIHGIEREWNFKGRLSRGYPRYWLHDERVTKPKYVRAALKDPALPPFRIDDNEPRRDFPPEVAKHLIPRPLHPHGK